jgi:hypothetical protein
MNKINVASSWGVTKHRVYEGDARDLSFVQTERVHLICTRLPHASLRRCPVERGLRVGGG